MQSDRPGVAALLERGEAAFAAGETAEAERCFREAARLDPGCVQAHNDLGVLLYQAGDAAGAALCFVEALRLDPDDRSALANAAELLLAAGQAGSALPLLDRYLAKHADDAEIRALRARCAPPATGGDAPSNERAPARPRVLVGTHNIAAYVGNLTAGLRALGFPTDAVLLQNHKFYGDQGGDYFYEDVMRGSTITRDERGDLRCQLSRETLEFLLGYDLYVFVAAHSFLPGNLDFPILERAGKTIVSWLCGSEVRYWSAAAPMWSALGSRLPSIVRDTTQPSRTEVLGEIVSQGRYHNTLANRLHNTRMAERYSKVIFSVPETYSLGIRPYMSIRAPIDLQRFRFHVPGREVPVVLHAPSSRGFKQSELILKTLDRLRDEGVAFELRLLENAPHEAVIEALADADVVIDEMSLYPAILSHEAMASGCAVLTGNVPCALPVPRDKPALHIEPANLYAQAKRALTDRALRVALAEQGRAYVERWAARDQVARAVVESLDAADAGRFDVWPTRFFDGFEPPVDDIVPAYVRDLTLEVLRRHGAPPEADLARLAAAGLLPAGAALDDVPRWTAPTREIGPWIRARAGLWDAPTGGRTC
jgi:tetratricopeptide (TPR) repeat protein